MLNVLWGTIKIQMKNSWARPMFRFTLLASPMLNTVLIYEMFRHSGQSDAASYIILGSGLMGLWSSICFSSIGDIARDRYMGVLPFLFTSPSNYNVLIVAKTISNTLLASLTLVVSWLTAGLLFRLTLVIPHPIVFGGALLVTIIGFVAISIPISYLMLLSRKTGLYMNVLDIPVTLLCGFVFPLSVLPRWTQPLSQALVPTWSTRLLHLALQPTIDWSALRTVLAWNGSLILLYVGLTVVFWHAIQLRVRRNATLEVSE